MSTSKESSPKLDVSDIPTKFILGESPSEAALNELSPEGVSVDTFTEKLESEEQPVKSPLLKPGCSPIKSISEPRLKTRHSVPSVTETLRVSPVPTPSRRKSSFLNLHIPEPNWKGSLTHLHLPTFTLTTPDGEHSLASKFTFGLGLRRHSHNVSWIFPLI